MFFSPVPLNQHKDKLSKEQLKALDAHDSSAHLSPYNKSSYRRNRDEYLFTCVECLFYSTSLFTNLCESRGKGCYHIEM